jgi:hypothetical protein
MSAQQRAVSLDTAKEIIRLSEQYIDGTMRLSLASDSRAMQFSGILSASSTALVIASIGFLTQGKSIERNQIVIVASLVAVAILFAVALTYSIRAAAPRNFNVNGNYWNEWSSDNDLYGPLSEALIGQARIYQEQINENKETLYERSRRINTALTLIGFAPLLALVAGVIAYFGFDSVEKLIAAVSGLAGLSASP